MPISEVARKRARANSQPMLSATTIKTTKLRDRQRQQTDKAPFYQRHRSEILRWNKVGVTVRIVYGPIGAMAIGAGHWISLVACLHNSAGTDFCSADLDSAACALIHRGSVATAAESMSDVFDIYTIIFLALAVFIFLRLRSVLGQRTGRERPPYDPYSARDAVRPSTNDNVVALPGRGGRAPPSGEPAEPAEPLGRALPRRAPASPPASTRSRSEDKTFDAKHFVTGARAAYEMIVTAYAEGDRRTLKNLLSRDVYEGFEAAIRTARPRARPPRPASSRSTSPTSRLPTCVPIPRT